MTLKQEIDAFVAEAAGRLPPDVLADVEKSIEAVAQSGLVDRALTVGDPVPDFVLPNAVGEPVALADKLRHGPVIVSFYRGAWCPYCNLELRAYQRILPEIRAAGGDFIAISPQTPDNSLSTAERNALAFEVLSDHRNRVAAAFGIAYPTPEIVQRITGMFGVDIARDNGSDDGQLPISATYVVDTQQRIAAASIDPDFRVRLEPAAAFDALKKLVA